MAIGTTAAILGGSALLAGGQALSASSANKSVQQASADATATARENNALTREIYGKNEATLSPFVQTGTAAGALLNDFYGIPQSGSSISGEPDYAAYAQANPDILADFQKQSATGETPSLDGGFSGFADVVGGIITRRNGGGATPAFAGDMAAFGQQHWQKYGQNENRALPGATVTPNAGSSRSAFANYITNSDYAFQQQEGGNQVNSGYAGTGTVQSGAAMKALEKYRQNLQSGYRQQWAGGVANQQGVGAQAASALAGVATNYGNTIAASNTAASDARANAALSQQNVFGNALGTAGGALLKGFG